MGCDSQGTHVTHALTPVCQSPEFPYHPVCVIPRASLRLTCQLTIHADIRRFPSAITALAYRRDDRALSTRHTVPPVELPHIPNEVLLLSACKLYVPSVDNGDPERSPNMVPGSCDDDPPVIRGQRSELVAVEMQITLRTARH